ncbi:MAG: NUDIX domain-containing protein [Rhodanobacter thiooxydans]|nr:NUDIX domain-containing protein [Rhodanobacter thiooxydans]
MPASVPCAVMHVMAGLLLDADGRVLLAQRPPGKHLAGLWEFPGGKREPGEAPVAALARELHEELGVTLQHAEPLIALPWRYGERELLLDAWRVDAWIGEPRPLEGQALQWQFPALIDMAILTPADCPILRTLIEARGAAEPAR